MIIGICWWLLHGYPRICTWPDVFVGVWDGWIIYRRFQYNLSGLFAAFSRRDPIQIGFLNIILNKLELFGRYTRFQRLLLNIRHDNTGRILIQNAVIVLSISIVDIVYVLNGPISRAAILRIIQRVKLPWKVLLLIQVDALLSKVLLQRAVVLGRIESLKTSASSSLDLHSWRILFLKAEDKITLVIAQRWFRLPRNIRPIIHLRYAIIVRGIESWCIPIESITDNLVVPVVLDFLGRVFIVHHATLSLTVNTRHASLIDVVCSAIFVILFASILIGSILAVVIGDSDDIEILSCWSLLGQHISVWR